MQRSPAVAGRFYPADPDSLRDSVLSYLGSGEESETVPLALVVPHAGYVYSGRTAGLTYAAAAIPERVLLLGPNHTGRGHPGAIWSQGEWQTPWGPVAVDTDLAAALLAADTALVDDREAHLGEHSLEVQLPFLLQKNPAVRIVPLCLSDLGLATLLRLGESIGQVLAASDGGPVLMVISSDMTHYEPAETARCKDRLAIEKIEQVDPEGLYRTVREGGITMCGVIPAVVGLAAARVLGGRRARLVDYSCSGDVTGDDSDVVAYAGLTVT